MQIGSVFAAGRYHFQLATNRAKVSPNGPRFCRLNAT